MRLQSASDDDGGCWRRPRWRWRLGGRARQRHAGRLASRPSSVLQDRLGAEPARRSTRSSARTRRTTRSGRSTGTCSSTSAPRTSLRSRASPRAGTSPTTRRRSPSTSTPNAKWSDGKPITSADVKYSLEVLGEPRRAVHELHGQRHLDRHAGRSTRSSSTPSGPTPGSSAASSSTSFPSTSGARCRSATSPARTSRSIPLVGSGPYVVTDFQPNRILKMERNPNFRGPEPKFDKIEFIRYGNQDAAERALQLGEVDMVPEVSAAGFARLGDQPNIETLPGLLAGVHAAGVQHVPGEDLPGRELQPRDPGPRRPPGDRLRGRPGANQRDRRPGHLVPGPRDPAVLLQVVLRAAGPGLSVRPGEGQADPRRRRVGRTTATARGPRATRSSRSTCTCARSRRTTSRRRS